MEKGNRSVVSLLTDTGMLYSRVTVGEWTQDPYFTTLLPFVTERLDASTSLRSTHVSEVKLK